MLNEKKDPVIQALEPQTMEVLESCQYGWCIPIYAHVRAHSRLFMRIELQTYTVSAVWQFTIVFKFFKQSKKRVKYIQQGDLFSSWDTNTGVGSPLKVLSHIRH